MRDRYHPNDPASYRDHASQDQRAWWTAVSAGLVAGAVGLVLYQQQTRNKVAHRPPDSAPAKARRGGKAGNGLFVTGRTVTINRPRTELYDFWRSFTNLPQFMDNVRDVTVEGDLTRWIIAAPTGEVRVETRIVEDRQGERIVWESTPESQIETRGAVRFRDAPAGRGTEVEAEIAYVPPGGRLGRWIATAFQAEPALQGRRELKRFKMLMETGEIATNRNRKAA